MNAGAISRAMIETLRDTPAFAPTTRQNWTSRLRGFLAFEGLPIAAETDLWRFVKPVARKRPYLDPTKARTILARSEGRERLIVALGLFNGLRECEIARLRVRDFELAEFPPMVWVLGKGERGGKPRRIPVNPLAYGEVLPFLKGRRPEDPVYPGSYSTIDHAWRNAQRRAGFQPVGTHALRRSFGRISHDAGTPIEEIQAVMGHSSPGTTAEYIGVEETRIAKGMARMAAFFQEAR
ncbi:MAG: tyrosine-type recombinase/integrase [Thermoplasmata archaeon]